MQQRRKRSRPRCFSSHPLNHVPNEGAASHIGWGSDSAAGSSPACSPSDSRRRHQQRRLNWETSLGMRSPGDAAPLSPGSCRLAESEGIASLAMSAEDDAAAFAASIRQQQPSARGAAAARRADSSEAWQSVERPPQAGRPASPPESMFYVPESPMDREGHLSSGTPRASWHGGHGQRQTPPPPPLHSSFLPPRTNSSSGGRRVPPAAFVARLASATDEAGEDDAMQDLFPDSPRGGHSVGLASQRRLGQETARLATLHQPKKFADFSQFAFKGAL